MFYAHFCNRNKELDKKLSEHIFSNNVLMLGIITYNIHERRVYR